MVVAPETANQLSEMEITQIADKSHGYNIIMKLCNEYFQGSMFLRNFSNGQMLICKKRFLNYQPIIQHWGVSIYKDAILPA